MNFIEPKDIMNLEINQDNLHLLLPSKVSLMAEMLVEERGGSIVDAIKDIYLSETYERLENEETKMWHFGPVALYQDYLFHSAVGER